MISGMQQHDPRMRGHRQRALDLTESVASLRGRSNHRCSHSYVFFAINQPPDGFAADHREGEDYMLLEEESRDVSRDTAPPGTNNRKAWVQASLGITRAVYYVCMHHVFGREVNGRGLCPGVVETPEHAVIVPSTLTSSVGVLLLNPTCAMAQGTLDIALHPATAVPQTSPPPIPVPYLLDSVCPT